MLLKDVSPKRKRKSCFTRSCSLDLSYLDCDFTLGIAVDVYFPLKAGKEKWVYNKVVFDAFLNQAFLSDGEMPRREQWAGRLNFPSGLLFLIKRSLALLLDFPVLFLVVVVVVVFVVCFLSN